jgi:predicted CopG family antitoxin
MVSKNIAIRDELYERLDKLKEKNESFSDLIERLLDEGQKGSFAWVKKYLGIWKDMPEEFFEVMRIAHVNFEHDMNARLIDVKDKLNATK